VSEPSSQPNRTIDLFRVARMGQALDSERKRKGPPTFWNSGNVGGPFAPAGIDRLEEHRRGLGDVLPSVFNVAHPHSVHASKNNKAECPISPRLAPCYLS